jgi:hypothetical protein
MLKYKFPLTQKDRCAHFRKLSCLSIFLSFSLSLIISISIVPSYIYCSKVFAPEKLRSLNFFTSASLFNNIAFMCVFYLEDRYSLSLSLSLYNGFSHLLFITLLSLSLYHAFSHAFSLSLAPFLFIYLSYLTCTVCVGIGITV